MIGDGANILISLIDPATGEEIVYCEEKLEFECKPCMFISGDVVCIGRNQHAYDFTITELLVFKKFFVIVFDQFQFAHLLYFFQDSA